MATAAIFSTARAAATDPRVTDVRRAAERVPTPAARNLVAAKRPPSADRVQTHAAASSAPVKANRQASVANADRVRLEHREVALLALLKAVLQDPVVSADPVPKQCPVVELPAAQMAVRRLPVPSGAPSRLAPPVVPERPLVSKALLAPPHARLSHRALPVGRRRASNLEPRTEISCSRAWHPSKSRSRNA